MLEHYGTNSSVYKFHSCPVTGDAYLVFLTSVGNFINKNTNRTGQMSLLSEEEYLNEYGRRLVNSLVTRWVKFDLIFIRQRIKKHTLTAGPLDN